MISSSLATYDIGVKYALSKEIYISIFMKVFKTNSVVNECQEAFGFDTVRRQIIKRKIIF